MQLGLRITRLALSLVAAGALCAGVARAQEEAQGPPPPPPEARAVPGHMGPGGPDPVSFMAFEAGIPGKTVTGAPFSATITTDITHTLADGNSIHRTITANVARDSQGRTRREMTLPAMALLGPSAQPAKHAIFINDPVAGTSYMLRPEKKVANAMPARGGNGKGRQGPGAQGQMRGELGFGQRFKNEETTADLGTQVINGISAQGTLITRTIRAGEIGNEKPIVMTTERWYSPDLQIYVSIKRSDPLIGDTTVQYTNIQRQEPDAALFQVPSDYRISQGPARGAMRGRAAGGPGGAQQPEPPPQQPQPEN